MIFLLDTNVVSEIRKVHLGTSNPSVKLWASKATDLEHFISVATLEELEIGILTMERRDPRQGATLRQWFLQFVLTNFAGRILPIDEDVALRSARLHVPNRQPIRDASIAATALVHGMTVVTRNVADFASLGVAILNPWQD